MTEAQFWSSNPRIISVWEKAYRDDMSYKNSLIHSFVGTYGVSALIFAIDSCLNGRKAKAKYIEKPFDLFPKSDKEKKAEAAQTAFKAWADTMMKNYKKANKKGG